MQMMQQTCMLQMQQQQQQQLQQFMPMQRQMIAMFQKKNVQNKYTDNIWSIFPKIVMYIKLAWFTYFLYLQIYTVILQVCLSIHIKPMEICQENFLLQMMEVTHWTETKAENMLHATHYKNFLG